MNKNFLQSLLGAEGAKALSKAMERAPELRSVIVPRTIVSWLTLLSKFGYDGQIPGVDNSYLSLTKNSEDTFDGAMTIADKLYEFAKADILHVAASLSVALDMNLEPISEDLKVKDLTKLGKSIDVLIKNEFINKVQPKEESFFEINKNKDGYRVSFNNIYVDKIESLEKAEKVARILTKKIKEKLDKKSNTEGQEAHGIQVPHSGHQEAEKPLSPTKQPGMISEKMKPQQKVNIVGGQGRKIKILKSESEKVCQDCGEHFFKNENFVGCLCLHELSKNISTEKIKDDYLLVFDKNLDEDEVSTIVEILK